MTSLRAAVKKLSVKPGDIIVCKARQMAERVANIEIPLLAGTPVIWIENFTDIRTLSERAMNAHGWYKKPSGEEST